MPKISRKEREIAYYEIRVDGAIMRNIYKYTVNTIQEKITVTVWQWRPGLFQIIFLRGNIVCQMHEHNFITVTKFRALISFLRIE